MKICQNSFAALVNKLVPWCAQLLSSALEVLRLRLRLRVESERLIILVITGRRTDAQSSRREVGIGSNSHCLLGSEFKSSKTSASQAGWRIWRDAWEGGGGGKGQVSQR